jgi:nucleoside-diphosphate-sugar epimerase
MIFVTGDCGKIGGRARRLLEQAGHDVVGFDIQRDPAEDVRNPDALGRAMVGCEIVVHCAAIPHPRHGSFGHYFDLNVQGTKFVLEMASHVGVRRVVYISSTGYYGCDVEGQILPLYLPIDEMHPPGLAHLVEGQMESYDVSKIMAEQLVAFYGTNHMMETVVLRLAPANQKSWQYRAGFDWQMDASWKRGCLFSNCHPDYAAQAIRLAVEAEGPFWYEPFNITDQYTHRSVDVYEFAHRAYPGVPVSRSLKEHDSLITPRKAMTMLGFDPCKDLE